MYDASRNIFVNVFRFKRALIGRQAGGAYLTCTLQKEIPASWGVCNLKSKVDDAKLFQSGCITIVPVAEHHLLYVDCVK